MCVDWEDSSQKLAEMWKVNWQNQRVGSKSPEITIVSQWTLIGERLLKPRLCYLLRLCVLFSISFFNFCTNRINGMGKACAWHSKAKFWPWCFIKVKLVDSVLNEGFFAATGSLEEKCILVIESFKGLSDINRYITEDCKLWQLNYRIRWILGL